MASRWKTYRPKADDGEPADPSDVLLDSILGELQSIKTAVWWLVAFVVIGFAAAVLVTLASSSPSP